MVLKGKKMKKWMLIFAITLIIISCQQNKNEVDGESDKTFKITEAWMRPGVENRNTAAFMNIRNNTNIDDTLFVVSSDISKIVELHETFTTENEMKGMRHVKQIAIPAKTTLELKPGGHHVMFIGLNNDIIVDEEHLLTLHFGVNGIIKIPLKVQIE
jgi:hypothetical protein